MSLGPLTASFTPNGGNVLGDCVNSLFAWYNYNSVDFLGPATPSPCLPSNYDPAPTAYYSPGLYCPAGYVFVSSTTTANPTPGGAEQAVTWCCPGFLVQMSIPPTPVGAAHAASLSCQHQFVPGPITINITSLDIAGSPYSTATATTVTSGQAIVAYAIQLRNPLSTVSGTITPAATLSTTTVTVTPSPSPTENASPGLASGPVAGIAVGSAVAGAVIAAAILLLTRKRQRKVDQPAVSEPGPASVTSSPAPAMYQASSPQPLQAATMYQGTSPIPPKSPISTVHSEGWQTQAHAGGERPQNPGRHESVELYSGP